MATYETAQFAASKHLIDGGNAASIPQRDNSPVECALQGLSRNLESLHDGLRELRLRLAPVSAPQRESAIGSEAGGAKMPEAPKAPLEEKVENLALGIYRANSEISNLLAYLHI
jgi:hypothetical protein